MSEKYRSPMFLGLVESFRDNYMSDFLAEDPDCRRAHLAGMNALSLGFDSGDVRLARTAAVIEAISQLSHVTDSDREEFSNG